MKQDDFTEEHFELKVLIDGGLKHLFHLISTSEGLESWFLGDVQFYDPTKKVVRSKTERAQSMDAYHWKWQKDFELKGNVLNSHPPNFIEFDFGPSFTVKISLDSHSVNDSKVLVRLFQKNLNSSKGLNFSYINCCVCWTFFLTNLKSVCENNMDLRETGTFDESFINI